MSKRIPIVLLLVVSLVVGILLANAAEDKSASSQAKAVSTGPTVSKARTVTHLSKAMILRDRGPSETMQAVELWFDDFEGTQSNWIPDASWNHVAGTAGGRAYQPETSWGLVTTNSSSPTHSWNATEDLDQELDFLVSPVIYLPDSVEVEGIMSELKGLILDYMYDVDTPDGGLGDDQEHWMHLVGPAEDLWDFQTSNPGVGTSSWGLYPTDLSTEYHWRQWLVSPEIVVPSTATSCNLTFTHAYVNEIEFDYYAVDVSTDDFVSYTHLGHWGETGGNTTWTAESFSLDTYVGQTIKVRFSSKGDYGTAEGYWVIDEIKVTDNTGDLFYDDGGETGATDMTTGGFTAGSVPNGYFGESFGGANTNPNWIALDPTLEVAGWNTNFGAGDSIRIAFMWLSDGDTPQGRGLFIDDFKLWGVGLLAIDMAVFGVDGLQEAVLGEPFQPTLLVTNVGLETLSGQLIWWMTLKDADGSTVFTFAGAPAQLTDFAPGDVMELVPVNEWIPEEPGAYTLDVTTQFPDDGDPSNNVATFDVLVFGPPFAELLYREDFEPRVGETSLEDFGFTVVNGGGCVATGLNVNKWEYLGFIYGAGSALLSEFWGILDPGSDLGVPWDSSEVLDEELITPEIDISGLDPHATLFMNYYTYWRAGYGTYWPEGEQWNDFTIDFTIDGGVTWHEVFIWTDYDSVAGTGMRLPNCYYGDDCELSYISKLGVDLTPAVVMGGETMQVRFTIWSENSWFVAANIDEIVIYSGVGEATVVSVEDVPEDQGKQVRVTWEASFNDLTLYTAGMYGEYEEHVVTHYGLWREIPEDATSVNAIVVPDLRAMFTAGAEPGDRFIVEETGWDFIAAILAHDDLEYNYVAPTLWDEVMAVFMVSAHTEDPMIFVDSDPMGGMSVDNLAPGPPSATAASQEDGDGLITWEASPDEDVSFYSVYRSGTSGGPYDFIVDIAELTYLDEELEGGWYYYVITATDYGSNESEYSNEAPLEIVGVDGQKVPAIPTTFALSQNRPNPFNPVTTIKYQLPEAADVTLRVYNVVGQVVATLVENHQVAGYYSVELDAQGLASGVYFYEIRAGDFVKCKKMALLK